MYIGFSVFLDGETESELIFRLTRETTTRFLQNQRVEKALFIFWHVIKSVAYFLRLLLDILDDVYKLTIFLAGRVVGENYRRREPIKLYRTLRNDENF